MKNIKQKLILGVAIIIVIIIAVTISVYLSQKKGGGSVPTAMAITESTPTEGASGVNVFDPIIITFNQNVDPLTITATSNPTENWSVSQTSPKTVNIDHKLYLRVATTYTLTILQHGSIVGTLTFETASEQNDPRQLQSLQSELNKNYPLASLTPYETPDFRVVYGAPLTLDISIKSSIGAQSAISQVQAWVKSNGIDPATHKYIVVTPTPTPQP